MKAYWELCKPRVVMLMLLSALVGALMAPPTSHAFITTLVALLGIAFLASSGACFNHILDRHLDALMNRTQFRPLPQGAVSTTHALVFAIILGVLGFLTLMVYVNPMTAYLTLFSMFGYAVIYSVILKRLTPQNIVIGGIFGALPPLLGWTALSPHMAAEPLLVVMVIFLWTPPHFWALALHRKHEYAEAKLPMLPVTHGESITRLFIGLYAILTTVSTYLPLCIGMVSIVYLVLNTLLNLVWLQKAYAIMKDLPDNQPYAFFRFSIVYLFLYFIMIVLDQYLV